MKTSQILTIVKSFIYFFFTFALSYEALSNPQTDPKKNDTSRIFVLRPSIKGFFHKESIWDGDSFIGELSPKSFLCWERSAGWVDVIAERGGSLKIQIKGGEEYFILAKSEMDQFSRRPLLLLSQILDENEGIEYLVKCGAKADVNRNCEHIIIETNSISGAPISGPEQPPVEEKVIEPKPEPVRFLVFSNPPGAILEVNGIYLGKTPTFVNLDTESKWRSENILLNVTPSNLDYPSLGIFFYEGNSKNLKEKFSSENQIRFVVPTSPADKLGLLKGDEVLTVNGQNIRNVHDFSTIIRKIGFDSQVTIEVDRNGITYELVGRTSLQNNGIYYTQSRNISRSRLKTLIGQSLFFNLTLPSKESVKLGNQHKVINNAKGDTDHRPIDHSPQNPDISPKTGISSGTGFAITDNGFVLTCSHVVKDAVEIIVVSQDETQHDGTIFLNDGDSDWCLLRVPTLKVKPLPIAPSDSLRVGANIFCLGYPLKGILENLAPVAGSGNIASLQGLNGDPKHLQITIPINPGNSGSPIIDEYGRFIGIATHKLNDTYSLILNKNVPQGINFALKGSIIEALISLAPNIRIPSSEISRKMDLEEIVKTYSNSIVAISAKK